MDCEKSGTILDGEECADAEKEVFRRTDRLCPEPGGHGDPGRRDMPEFERIEIALRFQRERCCRGGVLPVEEGLYRDESRRDLGTETA